MTTFLAIAAIIAFLVACWTAYRIGAAKPIAHVHFGVRRENRHTDIDTCLTRCAEIVHKRQERKRDKQGKFERVENETL